MSEKEERKARLERVSIDIDTRLASIWAIVWDPAGVMVEVMEDENVAPAIGAIMRAAYAQGYEDALQEDAEGRRAELSRANGYGA